MKFFFDMLIAVPIGLLYNLMVLKIGEISNANVPYKLKMQRNLLLAFGSAALAFFLANYVFQSTSSLANRAVQYGLWLGMIILLVHVMLYNWHVLENDTKLIIMMITFAILLIYSYGFSNNQNEKEEILDDIDDDW